MVSRSRSRTAASPPGGGWSPPSEQQAAQLGKHRRRILEDVAVGVAARLVAARVRRTIPPAVGFEGLARVVPAVAVELHGHTLCTPPAVDPFAVHCPGDGLRPP